MKNLLFGTIILFLFAISISLVQMSCSKTNAQQNRPATPQQINKLVFLKKYGMLKEIWTANYDGSNETQVPVNLPPNVKFDNTPTWSISVSPDGQKLFFSCIVTNGTVFTNNIYSCDIDGSNLQVVIAGANNNNEPVYSPIPF